MGDDGAALADLLAFLNAAPVGLVQLAPDGRIEMINALSARLLLPVSASRRLDNLFDLLEPLAPGLRQRVAASGTAYGPVGDPVRLHLVPGDGPPAAARWLSLQLLRLDTQRLLGVLADVTEQVHDEQALQSSREQLQFTLDAVQLGDWSYDLDSRLLTGSQRFSRCLGRDEPVAGWTAEQFIQQLHADDRDAVGASLRHSIAQALPWQAEFRVVWPDGSLHWVAAHGHVQLEQGRACRVVGVLIDATASREAQAARLRVQELEAENRHILAISRFKSQLLATLSHEFRTPLNAIIGFADLLAAGRKVPDAERLSSYVGHIGNSGRSLLRLLNSMLDLSKAQADGLEFEPGPVQIGPLLQDVAGLLAASAQRKQLQLTVEVGPGLDELQLDPVRLRQVVFNYLDNAIRFTPPGGHVSVRACTQGPEQMRIEVEDTGPGIALADQAALFDEFSTLDPGPGRVRDGAGLGLGLALVRRLVQAQGGQVGVRSVPGQGSVFHLVLNRVQGRVQGPEPGASPPDGGTSGNARFTGR